jgi:hypothetical protein
MTIDITVSTAASTTHSILERAGFQIRGKRATCPYCTGNRNRNLTVSVTSDGMWYCHRCQRGGNIRGLARQQGVSLPPPRVRKADIPKAAFRAWLDSKVTEIAQQEYQLTREWRRAVAILESSPETDSAWQALAAYYDKQRYFETFWQSASDKVGRYWLYRAWRRHYAR